MEQIQRCLQSQFLTDRYETALCRVYCRFPLQTKGIPALSKTHSMNERKSNLHRQWCVLFPRQPSSRHRLPASSKHHQFVATPVPTQERHKSLQSVRRDLLAEPSESDDDKNLICRLEDPHLYHRKCPKAQLFQQAFQAKSMR